MNVVLVVTDDQPYEAYDEMPYMGAASAANGWVTFTNSVNSCPICGPSRVTMLTGQQARRNGNADNTTTHDAIGAGIDQKRMIGRVMQTAGYRTIWLGKYINGYPWSGLTGDDHYVPPGWDTFISPRPNLYTNFRFMVGSSKSEASTGSLEPTFNSGEYRTDEEVARLETEITAAVNDNRPFFAMWAPTAPHRDANGDVVPAARHEGLTISSDVTAKPSWNEADISDKPTWVQSYSLLTTEQQDDFTTERTNVMKTLRAVDEAMESLVDHLTTLGVLDDTVIIFWSDNGFLYGEHRHIFGKGVPYEESIRLGLKVRWPGVTGRDDAALVSNFDIAPTVCDIANTNMPDAPDGMSFASRVQDAGVAWRDAVLIQRESEEPTSQYRVGAYTAVRTATHIYIEHEDGTGDKELYDLDADPYQLTNVAGTGLAVETALAAKLDRLKAAQVAPPA